MQFDRLKRREFVTLLSGAAAVWPLAARAQQPRRTRRVGILMGWSESDQEGAAGLAAVRRGLQELGWAEGRDLRIDVRWAAGDSGRAANYTAELVGLAPDVILAHGTPALRASKSATTSIPIVFVQVADPIEQGFISNMPHPGGHITGFMGYEFSVAGKWLQTLKEAVPRITRVAVMFNPKTAPYSGLYFQKVEDAAASLAVGALAAPVHEVSAIEGVIAALAPQGGLIVIPDSFTLSHREVVIEQAERHRVPAIYPYRFYAAAGGLISHGIDAANLFYRAASYVDRILKGEKPADLPVQAPTKYELVINLKTAKALGLTVPDTLLARADEVIE